jgi:c-di-GMP-binding flagellar brake protein YcgR
MNTVKSSTRPGAPAFGLTAGSTRSESGAELRHHRRARASWPARLRNKAGGILHVTVCDVSEGGVGLLAQTSLPLGTNLDIALSVPDAKVPGRTHAVRASVRVMFSSFVGSQCRVGVQFVELPMAARVAIHTYVVTHS